jgi:uncharacterized protein
MKMGTIGWIAMILVLVGALNWGLVGFFDVDIVASIFGSGETLTKVVYDIVGLAAVYMVIMMLVKPAAKE